jgi:hypothetical protein
MERKLFVIAAAMGLMLGTTAVQAQMRGDRDTGGTPGHMMQEKGPVPGHPGASGYAPGHDRDANKGDRDDRMHRGDRDDRMTGAGDRDDSRRGDRDEFRKGDRDDFRKGDRDDFRKDHDR